MFITKENDKIAELLQKKKFQKKIDKIAKKYKDSKILVYGTGILFDVIFENYETQHLNIVGVSDKKFSENDTEYRNFKVIKKEDIISLKPDLILICAYDSDQIKSYLNILLGKNTKTKIMPFLERTFFEKNVFMNVLKKTINLSKIYREDEHKKFEKILNKFDKNITILDVGCGYGNKLKFLHQLGFNNIIGIEINEEIVKENIKEKLNVLTVEEFNKNYIDKKFDLLIMSHIIEHFQYKELKEFIEHYLKFLNDDGYLLIMTPIAHEKFYYDFDHVKPYYPSSILSIFGGKNAQVQFYSKYILRLRELYYRKWPYSLVHCRSLMIESSNKLPQIINYILAVLYKLSFGFIGQTTGWIGLFKKVK